MFYIYHSFAFFIKPYDKVIDSIQFSSCLDSVNP